MATEGGLLGRRSIAHILEQPPTESAAVSLGAATGTAAGHRWIVPRAVTLATDLRPVGTGAEPVGTATRKIYPKRSELLKSYKAAVAASQQPMFHGGPSAGLFRGAKQGQLTGFFGAVDAAAVDTKRFRVALASMCWGRELSREESIWVNGELRRMMADVGLTMESVGLPAGVAEKAAGSDVRFYPAEFGTKKWILHGVLGMWNRGICTWKRGKNGVSIKITNAFKPNTYQSSPLCMGEGPYEVLEFVIEIHKGAFRLNVIERDANGGSRHSRAAILETVKSVKGKAIVDGQLFVSKKGEWLPRSALVGPMEVRHGRHVARRQVLEVRRLRGDGKYNVTHWWDVYGAGGWNHALVSKKGRVVPVPDDFAKTVAKSKRFKKAHPEHVLVQLPRYEGRNL